MAPRRSKSRSSSKRSKSRRGRPAKRKSSKSRSRSRSRSRSNSGSKTSPKRRTRSTKRKTSPVRVPSISHFLKKFNGDKFAHELSIFHVVNRIILFSSMLTGFPRFARISKEFGAGSVFGLADGFTPIRAFFSAITLIVGLSMYRFAKDQKYKQRGAFIIGVALLAHAVLDYFYGGFLKTGNTTFYFFACVSAEQAAFFLSQVKFVNSDKGFHYLLRRLEYATDTFFFLKVTNLLSAIFQRAPTFQGDVAYRRFLQKHGAFSFLIGLVNRLPFVHIEIDQAYSFSYALIALSAFLLFNGSTGKVAKFAREVRFVKYIFFVLTILSAAYGCVGRFNIFELYYIVIALVSGLFLVGTHLYNHH